MTRKARQYCCGASTAGKPRIHATELAMPRPFDPPLCPLFDLIKASAANTGLRYRHGSTCNASVHGIVLSIVNFDARHELFHHSFVPSLIPHSI